MCSPEDVYKKQKRPFYSDIHGKIKVASSSGRGSEESVNVLQIGLHNTLHEIRAVRTENGFVVALTFPYQQGFRLTHPVTRYTPCI